MPRRDRPADQKTTNYTASRLTLGGQGRERERDGGTLNSLQGRINTREWGHRLTGDLLGCNTNTLTLRANVNPSVTRWTLKKMFNAFFIINRDRNELLHWYLLLYFLQPTKVLFYVLSIVFPSSCERLSVFFYRLQAAFTFIVLNVPRLREELSSGRRAVNNHNYSFHVFPSVCPFCPVDYGRVSRSSNQQTSKIWKS